jgi:hypothetical protein
VKMPKANRDPKIMPYGVIDTLTQFKTHPLNTSTDDGLWRAVPAACHTTVVAMRPNHSGT